MRFALILAVLTTVFVSSEAAAGRSRAPKHHARAAAAKAKATLKTSKRSHKASTNTARVAAADTDEVVHADSAETPSMPKVATSAPVSGSPVAQAADDEQPPTKQKR